MSKNVDFNASILRRLVNSPIVSNMYFLPDNPICNREWWDRPISHCSMTSTELIKRRLVGSSCISKREVLSISLSFDGKSRSFKGLWHLFRIQWQPFRASDYLQITDNQHHVLLPVHQLLFIDEDISCLHRSAKHKFCWMHLLKPIRNAHNNVRDRDGPKVDSTEVEPMNE